MKDSPPGPTGADYLGAGAFPRGSADSTSSGTPPGPEGTGPDSDAPLHPLPEEGRPRTGAFGASTALHLVVLALVVSSGFVKKADAPPRPPLTIALLEQPQFDNPRLPPIQSPPTSPRTETAEPKRAEPAQIEPKPAERKPIQPPEPPKVLPAPAPVPPPTRMGEIVPVPHYPVAGTVPPEEGESGSPGPPAPPTVLEPPTSGNEAGTSETDPGIGRGAGPGSGGEGALGSETGLGDVKGGPLGGIQVPRLGGGSAGKRGSEGEGNRRGLNLELPTLGGTFGDFAFESKDYDWSDYHSQMYWRILYAWYNRLYVMLDRFDRWSYQHGKAHLKGTVLIRFVIERSGTLSSIEVLEPSVMDPLEESATGALKEVILPALPADFKKDRERVTGRFTIGVDADDIPAFKQEMRFLKDRGKF